MANNVFAVPVFFIVFRETIEAAIIIAVLLAFLKKTLDGPNADVAVYKSLVKQIWLGAVLGFLLCLIVGGALIGTFYTVGSNAWSAAEYYYEGVFYLLAAVIISVMGVALLRIGKMQEKWRVKLAEALDASVQTGNARGRFKRFATKYSLFTLSFITVSREGIEGVAFISGVSFSAPAKSIPLPVVTGLLAGSFVGWVMYKGGSLAKLRIFLTVSTCLLYLVAAGLVARSVWYFEAQHWKILVGGDAAEMGSGPGSYDIDRSVWHVNCCSPDVNGGGGWGIFNGIFGWTNSATYSTVISYNVYWILVIVTLVAMRFHEVNGHWPLLKPRRVEDGDSSDANAAGEIVLVEAGGNDSGDLRTNDKKMD